MTHMPQPDTELQWHENRPPARNNTSNIAGTNTAGTNTAGTNIAETIVLLHGFTQQSSAWNAFRHALGPDYRTICVDLPGHGASAPWQASQKEGAGEGWNPALCALERVAAQAEAHHAWWVGYSMGGRIALALAVRHHLSCGILKHTLAQEASQTQPPGGSHALRMKGLVLISTSPGLETEAARKRRRAADEVLAQQIEAEAQATGTLCNFVERWLDQPLFAGLRRLPTETQAALHAERLAQHPAGLAWALRHLGTGCMPSLWHELPRLRLPLLCIAGTEDPRYLRLAKRMRSITPGARLRRVSSAGHALLAEAPQRLAEQVRAFLHAAKGSTL